MVRARLTPSPPALPWLHAFRDHAMRPAPGPAGASARSCHVPSCKPISRSLGPAVRSLPRTIPAAPSGSSGPWLRTGRCFLPLSSRARERYDPHASPRRPCHVQGQPLDASGRRCLRYPALALRSPSSSALRVLRARRLISSFNIAPMLAMRFLDRWLQLPDNGTHFPGVWSFSSQKTEGANG